MVKGKWSSSDGFVKMQYTALCFSPLMRRGAGFAVQVNVCHISRSVYPELVEGCLPLSKSASPGSYIIRKKLHFYVFSGIILV